MELGSTLLVLNHLGQGECGRLDPDVEQLALRRIVDQRRCPLCGVRPGELCHVFGGVSVLTRTHHQRLQLTTCERDRVVAWALSRAAKDASLMDTLAPSIPT